MHPGPGGGPSVEDWFGLLSRRRDGPWLAHRLDADTSGCLVVALRRMALHAAQACFADGRAGKIYWAIVGGAPAVPAGLVDLPLLRHSTAQAGWRMRPDPQGAPARTRYRVLGRTDTTSWLELELLTGRTHQARLHCASLGCPILGDTLYGSETAAPLNLLARAIRLPLDPPVAAIAPPPPHMLAALLACGWRPDR